jgi:hypothetical protein
MAQSVYWRVKLCSRGTEASAYGGGRRAASDLRTGRLRSRLRLRSASGAKFGTLRVRNREGWWVVHRWRVLLLRGGLATVRALRQLSSTDERRDFFNFSGDISETYVMMFR